MKIREKYPDAVMVFISPPSFAELEARIRRRNMDSEASLKHRLENARKELSYKDQYRYSIVNDNLAEAIKELDEIFCDYIGENSCQTCS
jgi:guanylate kinase